MSDPVSQLERPAQEPVIRWAVFEDISRLEAIPDIWELRDSNLQAFQAYRMGRLLWLVAEIGGRTVGTVWGELYPAHDRSGRTVHIVSFRVEDAFQGRGIGSRLLRTVENEARRRGRKVATLFVAQDNHRAIRLYQRHGYAIGGTRTSRFDYRDPAGRRHTRVEEQYVMHKSLEAGESPALQHRDPGH